MAIGVDLAPGDVVQITDPEEETFHGLFVVVDEVKSWGVKGSIPTFNNHVAYVRFRFEQIEYVGTAPIIPKFEGEGHDA